MMESVKKLIRSVLMSSKEGVPAGRFPKDYENLTLSVLKPEKYGFESVAQLMRSVPDVVHISQSGGVTTYHAVTSSDTAHIQKLVSKQKSKKKKRSTSYKCNMPHQRYSMSFFNAHRSSLARHRGYQTGKAANTFTSSQKHIRPKNTERRTLSVKSATTAGSNTQKRPAAGAVPNKQKQPNVLSPCDATKVSPITINRIKTLLSESPSGIFSHNIGTLYFQAYGCQLSESVVRALEAGSFKDFVKVDKFGQGAQTKYILYPIQKGSENSSENKKPMPCNRRVPCEKPILKEKGCRFSFDPSSNKMVASDIIKNRIKTLLHENQSGIPLPKFGALYEERFGSKISDSVAYGLECGQIGGLAQVIKRRIGNRELVTFYPVNAIVEPQKKGNNSKPVNLPKQRTRSIVVEKRVMRIIMSMSNCIKELDINTLAEMYLDEYKENLKPEEMESIKKGSLKELVEVHITSSGEVMLIVKTALNAASTMPKYPAIFMGQMAKKEESHLDLPASPYSASESVTSLPCLPQCPTTSQNSTAESFKQITDNKDGELDVTSNATEKEDMKDEKRQFQSELCESDLERISQSATQVKCKVKMEKRGVIYFVPPKRSHYKGRFGKFVNVQVTRVLGPDWFYMVPIELSQHLLKLASDMKEYFNKAGAKPSATDSPEVGDTVYAALCRKGNTRSWRRVTVKNIMADVASVFMVDYGLLECVAVKSIRSLPPDLSRIPKMAMVGKLGGIVMKQSCEVEVVTKYLEDAVVGYFVSAHIFTSNLVKGSLVFDVCLYFEDEQKMGHCVNDLMVEEWKVADFIA